MNAVAETPAQQQAATPLVRYSPSDAAIADLRDQFAGLPAKVNEPGGYEACHKAIQVIVKHRSAVERTKKELKADALRYTRLVDSEYHRVMDQLYAVETPLREARDAVDAERGRLKREAEEKEAKRIEDERLAKLAAEEKARQEAWEAQQAILKKQADELAEQKRKLDEQRQADLAAQKAAQDKLDALRREDDERRLAERRRLDQEAEALRKSQRKEQDKLDEDRRKLQQEKDRLAAAQLAKEAAEKAEADAREKVRLEQEQAEAARLAKEAADAAEAARVEALRPDAERLHRWADAIEAIHPPEVQSDEAHGDCPNCDYNPVTGYGPCDACRYEDALQRHYRDECEHFPRCPFCRDLAYVEDQLKAIDQREPAVVWPEEHGGEGGDGGGA